MNRLETPKTLILFLVLLMGSMQIGCGSSDSGPGGSDDLGINFAQDTSQSCQQNSDCPTTLPYCSLVTFTCVQCTAGAGCEGTSICLNGTCAPPGAICGPGTLRCLGFTIQQCADDGMSYIDLEVCPNGCANNQCTECLPTQERCTDSVAEVCANDGSGWNITQDCGAEGMSCFKGQCIGGCGSGDIKQSTNVGCDYWAVDLDNHYDAQNGPFAVIISNLSDTGSEISIYSKDSTGAQEIEVTKKTVAPGQLEIFELPQRHPGGSSISWSAYRIKASAPIIAYQFNPLDNVDVFSNDASLLLPANTYGTEYIIMSRGELQGGGPEIPLFESCQVICGQIEGGYCQPDPGNPFGGEYCVVPYRGTMSVMAPNPDTHVTIVSSASTLGGLGVAAMQPGQSYEFTLQPFQVLNIKTDQDLADLTGTIVTSDKPIAVFGGHEASITNDRCCADHLEQQMFPVKTWGKTYAAAKSMKRSLESDYWRIVAAEDGTQVSFSPAVASSVSLNRGQWAEVVTDQDFVITSNKPIMVGQMLASSQEILTSAIGSSCSNSTQCHPGYSCEMMGANFEYGCLPPMCQIPNSSAGCPAGHNCSCFGFECYCWPVGDPALILTAPVEQFRDEYVFLTPNQYVDDYVNIVAPKSAAVTLDNMAVPAGNFEDMPGTDFKVARIKVADGVHKVTANQDIGVIVYGYDKDVSYGYTAGLNLSDL